MDSRPPARAELGRRGPERLVHWIAAGLSLCAAGLALNLLSPPDWSEVHVQRYMAGIEHHKTLGLAALAAAAAWPWLRRPRPERSGPKWARRLATAVHLGLFAALLALPVSGYLSSTLFGNGLTLSGLVEIPPLLAKNDNLAGVLHQVHRWSAYVFLVLAGVHTTAAAVHAARRDGVWATMSPFGKGATRAKDPPSLGETP